MEEKAILALVIALCVYAGFRGDKNPSTT